MSRSVRLRSDLPATLRLPVQQNVAVEELRLPVQDVPHGPANALKALLTPWILLARASLLLTLEHDNHEHLGRIGLTAHHQGLQQTGVLLFDGTQLLEDLQNLCFPIRIAGSAARIGDI